ncbi:hypothetical protein GCM10009830_28580 [Glycomyces endophyticus]|uniref:Uncharacterized protein n=1 Tax=Glycomyces endophyticus TaxID=480996 RepID=A0ABN2H0C1_9ACTN
MSGRTFEWSNGAVEYELRCDRCGDAFRCGDDSFYSWPVLCAAAEAEGWTTSPDLDGEHECTGCAAASARWELVAAMAA